MPRYTALSSRFDQALLYAVEIHHGQMRSKTGIPFVAHLLGVTALVLEHGGSELEAIAALLHDAVEDAGGRERLREIEKKFGPEVAALVTECTDSFDEPMPPWKQRKETYLSRLGELTDPGRLIMIADKVHNARALLRSYRLHGERVWSRYQGEKRGTLWYYRALAEGLQGEPYAALAADLDQAVLEIEQLADHCLDPSHSDA